MVRLVSQHTEVDCVDAVVLKGFPRGSSTQSADLGLSLLGGLVRSRS